MNYGNHGYGRFKDDGKQWDENYTHCSVVTYIVNYLVI